MTDTKKTVWVVEDDVAILEVTQIVLESAGYIAVALRTEEELFKRLAHEKPDILLLDVFVSGSDGREISKKLKQEELQNTFPIIFMSANANIEQIQIDGKADGYIKKPFDIDELVAVVEKHTALESRK